jgi:DNA polymerase-3 subunit gamma/tau
MPEPALVASAPVSVASEPESAPAVFPVEPELDIPPSSTLDVNIVQRAWGEVLSHARARSQRAAAVIREATVRDLDDNTVVLVFQHGFHAAALTKAPEVLQEALYQVLGVRLDIRCEVGGNAVRGLGVPEPRNLVAASPSRPAGKSAIQRVRHETQATPASPGGDEEPWPDLPPPVDEDESFTPTSPAPAPSAITYEGFEPGDEPVDEIVDAAIVHRTSEEQAMKLLSNMLGAEKI